jgi:hypothetical protein
MMGRQRILQRRHLGDSTIQLLEKFKRIELNLSCQTSLTYDLQVYLATILMKQGGLGLCSLRYPRLDQTGPI